jgi:iron complex transport system substrate-binding protein
MVVVLACGVMPAAAITVTDDAGTVITLNVTPSCIVSLAPANTEILAALGLLDRVVGVTDVDNYPPEVNNITRIGGYSDVSIEKVAAARPDLVLASDITPQETVDRLRGLGLTVVVVSPQNIDHVIQDIQMIGNVTGTRPLADLLARNLTDRLSAVLSCTLPSQRPTVAHVVWNEPLYVSGNDTLQNDVILKAGGVNAFAGQSGWYTVSLEEFLMKNPDIIIVSGGGGMNSSTQDVLLEDFMTNPQYASLSAVKNHRVYSVNSDIISRSGPRIVDAVEQMARDIHPECFVQNVTGTALPVSTPTRAPGFGAGLAVVGIGMVAFTLCRK